MATNHIENILKDEVGTTRWAVRMIKEHIAQVEKDQGGIPAQLVFELQEARKAARECLDKLILVNLKYKDLQEV